MPLIVVSGGLPSAPIITSFITERWRLVVVLLLACICRTDIFPALFHLPFYLKIFTIV